MYVCNHERSVKRGLKNAKERQENNLVLFFFALTTARKECARGSGSVNGRARSGRKLRAAQKLLEGSAAEMGDGRLEVGVGRLEMGLWRLEAGRWEIGD